MDLSQDTLRYNSIELNSVDFNNVKAEQHKCKTRIQHKNNTNTKKRNTKQKKRLQYKDSKKTAISIKYCKKKTKPWKTLISGLENGTN
jgi:hypothetical protein